MSSKTLSSLDIRAHRRIAYGFTMVTHIRQKRPFRLYIREWIEKKELDQKQVAERIGCEEGTLSKLISGKMRRTDEWLAAIAYALDIEITDLFRNPDKPSQQDLLANIPEQERDRIIRVIRALTGIDS